MLYLYNILFISYSNCWNSQLKWDNSRSDGDEDSSKAGMWWLCLSCSSRMTAGKRSDDAYGRGGRRA